MKLFNISEMKTIKGNVLFRYIYKFLVNKNVLEIPVTKISLLSFMNSAVEASQLSDNCPVPLWKFYFPNQGNININVSIKSCICCF